MPITFDCACGRHFNVGEKYAGKRTKCPSCAAPLTVPTPAAVPADAPSDEDAAYRALMDGSEPEPAAPKTSWDASPADAPAPRPKPEPPKIKARAAAEKPARGPAGDSWPTGYEAEPSRSGVTISSGVLGGAAMMLGAVVWFVVGWAAGVIFFYPPILFLIGLFTFVRTVRPRGLTDRVYNSGTASGGLTPPVRISPASEPMPDVRETQLLVIGGGPGGYPAALHAADHGIKVTLVDEDAEARRRVPQPRVHPVARRCCTRPRSSAKRTRSAEYGVTFGEPKLDLAKLRDFVQAKVVGKLTGGIGQLTKGRGVDVVKGRASFTSPNTVEVTGDAPQTIKFQNAIIATGSLPVVPKPWQINDDRVMDSTGGTAAA